MSNTNNMTHRAMEPTSWYSAATSISSGSSSLLPSSHPSVSTRFKWACKRMFRKFFSYSSVSHKKVEEAPNVMLNLHRVKTQTDLSHPSVRNTTPYLSIVLPIDVSTGYSSKSTCNDSQIALSANNRDEVVFEDLYFGYSGHTSSFSNTAEVPVDRSEEEVLERSSTVSLLSTPFNNAIDAESTAHTWLTLSGNTHTENPIFSVSNQAGQVNSRPTVCLKLSESTKQYEKQREEEGTEGALSGSASLDADCDGKYGDSNSNCSVNIDAGALTSSSVEAVATPHSPSSALFLMLPERGSDYDFRPYGYYHCYALNARGQFGCTHIVRSLTTHTKWLAKVIDLTELLPHEIRQTRKEVDFLKRLQHPYVVRYHDSFETNGSLVILMEHYERGDLFSVIQNVKKQQSLLGEEQVLEWFLQIVLGLHYIHSQKILHCDLKTTNIFLSNESVVKIGDLGIAQELQNDGTAVILEDCPPRGTPLYMSPEMRRNQPLSDKSDCWSLGCILYEMCCLEHAFEESSAKELLQSIESDPENVGTLIPSHYSSLVTTLVSFLLKQKPNDRLSLSEIISLLEISENQFLAELDIGEQ